MMVENQIIFCTLNLHVLYINKNPIRWKKMLVEGSLLEKIDKQDFSDLLCSLGLKQRPNEQRSHGSQHMEN